MEQKRFLVALRITTFVALCMGILGVFSGCGSDRLDERKTAGHGTGVSTKSTALTAFTFSDRNHPATVHTPLAPFHPLH